MCNIKGLEAFVQISRVKKSSKISPLCPSLTRLFVLAHRPNWPRFRIWQGNARFCELSCLCKSRPKLSVPNWMLSGWKGVCERLLLPSPHIVKFQTCPSVTGEGYSRRAGPTNKLGDCSFCVGFYKGAHPNAKRSMNGEWRSFDC